jgi:hypothetical protein
MYPPSIDIWDDGTPTATDDLSDFGLQSPTEAGPTSGPVRPFVGILFRCCGVYARIYRDAQGRAYCGACPKCAAPVRLRIGPGGTSARFFEAY